MASQQQPLVNSDQNNNPNQQPGRNVPAQQDPPNSSSPDPNQLENGMAKKERFDDQTIRAAFMRKVFFTVAVLLSVVAAMCSVPFFHKPLQDFTKNNIGIRLAYLITLIVVCFVLMCCDSVLRTFPINLFCTGFLTVSFGFLTMVNTAYHSIESVLMAAGIETVCGVGIGLFAKTTKRDITRIKRFIFIATMVMILFDILLTVFFDSRIMDFVCESLSALLFMIWLAIDIQRIMGGKKFEISPKEHIFAATMLFLYIIQIFWLILSLFEGRS